MPSADDLRQRIEAGLPGSSAEVQTDDEVHFSARVVSPDFAGKSRVQQHRMVYELFQAGELGGAIHALALKTETP